MSSLCDCVDAVTQQRVRACLPASACLHMQGLTWSERESVQVPDPGCKGGVVQAPSADAMVLATAASCKGRVNQTVFLSKVKKTAFISTFYANK